MKDEDICRLLLSRNEDGLSCLLDRYGSLIAYIIRNTGVTNEDDIAECISDIMHTVWKRIKKYDPSRSSFKTWLVIITRGCAINYLRKSNKYSSVISLDSLEGTYLKDLYSESSALERLLDPDLIQLLQEMPPPDNEIFYRRFVLGETVACIAGTLGLTQDNIYKRILRGKEKLKMLMEREGYNYG
ncbi:MAG TPA: sigma-70 family RNA polymerase sigma factor [Clostridiales bacterium]|nr:sigma-70 family RNA polymerase sigma factor [Clostridiales bacterium]